MAPDFARVSIRPSFLALRRSPLGTIFRRAAVGLAVVAGMLGAPSATSAWPRAHKDASPSTGLRTISFAKAPPDFAYDVGDGGTRLTAQLGKPIVLNFWATWCHPCLDELPVFDRLERDYGARVTLVTLSAEAPGIAREYLREHGPELPVAEDPTRRVFDAYSIGPIPVTLVLRSDGTVSHVSVGELDWLELSRAVDDAAARSATDGGEPARVLNISTGAQEWSRKH
jgi:thiol-disulfide isomerase/thioredoxin